jgi:hypothetical protein
VRVSTAFYSVPLPGPTVSCRGGRGANPVPLISPPSLLAAPSRRLHEQDRWLLEQGVHCVTWPFLYRPPSLRAIDSLPITSPSISPPPPPPGSVWLTRASLSHLQQSEKSDPLA